MKFFEVYVSLYDPWSLEHSITMKKCGCSSSQSIEQGGDTIFLFLTRLHVSIEWKLSYCLDWLSFFVFLTSPFSLHTHNSKSQMKKKSQVQFFSTFQVQGIIDSCCSPPPKHFCYDCSILVKGIPTHFGNTSGVAGVGENLKMELQVKIWT